MSRTKVLVPLVSLLAIAACADSPTSVGADFQRPSALIEDGTHNNGNIHFYWKTPTLAAGYAATTYAGTFKEGFYPKVSICEWGHVDPIATPYKVGCMPGTERTYNRLAGAYKVYASTGNEHYSLMLPSSEVNGVVTDANKDYRMRVIVVNTVVGYLDIDAVQDQTEADGVDQNEYKPYIVGSSTAMDVRFRLEGNLLYNMAVKKINAAEHDYDGLGTIPAFDEDVIIHYGDDVVPQETGIEIQPADCDAADGDSADCKSTTNLRNGAWRIGPDGLKFNSGKSVDLTLKFDPTLLNNPANAANVRIYRSMGGAGGGWSTGPNEVGACKPVLFLPGEGRITCTIYGQGIYAVME